MYLAPAGERFTLDAWQEELRLRYARFAATARGGGQRRLMWWFAGVPAATLAPTQVLSAPLSQPKPQSLISES